MFFCVFLLFSAVIIQLGKVQIIDGESYKNIAEKQGNSTISIPVPRGQIFDREGEKVVNNNAIRTITYTRMKGVDSEGILKTARDLANVLEMPEEDINKLTETDKKDFWVKLNKEKAQKRLRNKMRQNSEPKILKGKSLIKK